MLLYELHGNHTEVLLVGIVTDTGKEPIFCCGISGGAVFLGML